MNRITGLVIQPGRDEYSRSFVWYNSIENSGAKIQYCLKSEYDKNGFTQDNSTVVTGNCEIPYNNKENVSCKVGIENLSPGEAYVYKVGCDSSFDEKVYSFKTRRADSESLSFNVVADLHSKSKDFWKMTDGDIENSSKQWQNTLEKMLEYDEDSEFVLSAGDNVSTPDMSWTTCCEELRVAAEKEHKYFLEAELMKSIPFVTVNGNHEGHSSESEENGFACVSGYHFNLPGDDGVSGHIMSKSTGNFFLRRNETLIIGVNISVKNNKGNWKNLSPDVNEKYIEKVCNENKDVKWKLLVNHVPAYAYIGGEEGIKMLPVMNDICKKYNIDILFTGHSHAFSVSYPILDGKVTSKEKDLENPKGTVHYNVPSAMDHSFTNTADFKSYLRVWGAEEGASEKIENFDGIKYSSPMFTNVKITADELKINTVRSDNLNSIDEIIIKKQNNCKK